MSKNCPLCFSTDTHRLAGSLTSQVDFWSCSLCGLLFKDPTHHLSPEAEKQRYMAHQNGPESSGYVEFLRPVVDVIQELKIPAGARGLDYGCGPGPVLAQMLESSAYRMELFDPYFQPHLDVEPGSLDFLVCTEAAEHFYDPRKEVDRMLSLLKPGAPVVWLTSLWREDSELADWYYAKDPTHVSFYTERSAQWIGKLWGRRAHFRGKNLIWWS